MKLSHYQNITDEKGEDPNRKGSAYWNEGKWNNYIKPLLPTENRKDMIFVDIGANNGLFCKLAKDEGFNKAIGIEADMKAVERGMRYRDQNKYDYDLHWKEVGKNFYFDEMPVADVYLLSNVHYYIKLADWFKFLDRLQTKTEYCLIITRPIVKGNRKDWRPLTSIDAIKHYFRDWELVGARYRARQRHMEDKNDPSPRVLHAMLFRSRLRRKSFDSLIPGARADDVDLDRASLIEDIKNKVPIQEMKYYKAWKDRMYPKNWSEGEVFAYVSNKITTILNISEHGVLDPILVGADNKIIDGKHRIAFLKAEGHNSIITRMI